MVTVELAEVAKGVLRFDNILFLSVVVRVVILVGCKMKGFKEFEERKIIDRIMLILI